MSSRRSSLASRSDARPSEFVVAGKSAAQLEAWLKAHDAPAAARLKGTKDRFPFMKAVEVTHKHTHATTCWRQQGRHIVPDVLRVTHSCAAGAPSANLNLALACCCLPRPARVGSPGRAEEGGIQ